jgi:arsenite methyltransferase
MTRARYGLDAPYALLGLGIGAAIFIAGAIIALAFGSWIAAVLLIVVAVYLLASFLVYLHATTRGKFAVWDRILDGLALQGDERVLDLGCGRGAVLLAAAHRLRDGRATGADLWRSVDQSGNSIEVTRANAQAEGVADRIDLDTADMTELPYPDESFDLVLSSMAIHNIHPDERRIAAIDEAVRVLRPGGRLVIVDFSSAPAGYRKRLTELGLAGPPPRTVGWQMWWGGPWLPSRLVTAAKP